MRKFLLLLLAVMAFVSPSTQARAIGEKEIWNLYREGESAFKQANELFGVDPEKAQSLFEKALLCFEALHREGGIENGKLFYNIGNIHFRLGDIGRAILNFRRAEKFIPGDINLQQNLGYARSRTVDKIEPKPQTQVFHILFFWHYELSGNSRAWIFTLFFTLLWIFSGIYLLQKKSWLRHALLICALLSLLLASSLAVEAYQQSHFISGVILEKEVVGRKGDSAIFEPTFKEPLHAGVEFNLVEQRKGWLHIELLDGRRCWIPENAAEII